jgi:glutamate racemase
MRIGIFDSGLGGLIIIKSIIRKLPKYDYLYLGDTKNLPYGNKSQKQIYDFTKKALTYLFSQNCKLAIIACNTSSAKGLKKIQREFMPKYYPDRKVLGVIVPTVEAVTSLKAKRIGILATASTTKSHAYKREILKLSPKTQIYEQAAPLLTSLIEVNELNKANVLLKRHLKPLLAKKIDSLILGCTHYPILKNEAKKIVGKQIKVISQDEIIADKLKDYLRRHREIADDLSKKGERAYEVTRLNKNYKKITKTLFGKNLSFRLVNY